MSADNTQPHPDMDMRDITPQASTGRKRVAVLVDNFCLRDNRVIKSSEAMAAQGYEVRVFCRDGRKPIGDYPVNGVAYERNWVATLYYAQNLKSQWHSLRTFLFRMPGGFFAKFNFLVTAFLLMVAYAAKFVIDAVQKRRKEFTRERNKKSKRIHNQQTKAVRKLRKAKKVKFKKPRELLMRVRFKSYRGWRKYGVKVLIGLGLLLVGIIAFIPALIGGLIIGLALLWVLTNRFIQGIGQPEMNIAQKKAEQTTADNEPKPKKRIHARLLAILLSDKSDEAYVNRITKFRAARIYESTREAVMAFKPDLIHAHDLVNLPVGYYLGQDTGAKVIYDAHELETARDKPSHKRWKKSILKLEGHFAKKVDGIVTVSHGLSRIISETHKVPEPVIVYNTPDVSGSVPIDVNVRQEIGIGDDVPLGLYVGGLKITRGLPFFLEAMVQIPDMHFAACGPRTKKAEEDFTALAQSLGISDRFHMVGPVAPEYLLDYIAPCDFSIMPTQNIGLSYVYALPNKFFESMLSGIPIIVGHDIIEMADLLDKYQLGKKVKQNEPDDIARAMREFIAEKAAGAPRPDAHRLTDTFGWQSQIAKLAELYSSLIGKSATAQKDHHEHG